MLVYQLKIHFDMMKNMNKWLSSWGSWSQHVTTIRDFLILKPNEIVTIIFTIWLFNIANGKIPYKWRILAGKIIYKWAIFHGYVK